MKLKDLKHRAAAMLSGTLKMGQRMLGYLMDYAIAAMLVAGLGLMSLKAPEAYNHWLRAKVGSKVYSIRDSVNSGGGTGFAVMAPSGQSYILTNDHVCGVSKDGLTVLVSDDAGNMMRRNIVAHDDNSDLCLIEGLPGVKGLQVADNAPSSGDELKVVGHPRLMPLAVTKGEMLNRQDVEIMMGPIAVWDPRSEEWEQIDPRQGGVLPEQCKMSKNRQQDIDVDLMFFVLKVKICTVVVHQAYNTTVTIHPGNSGSPVVNFWGNVTGVAFAGSNETNWGLMVPQEDIKAFLKNY